MDVHQSQESDTPGYPDRKEFQRYRSMLGATVFGAGIVLSACSGNNVSARPLGGVAPINPADSRPPKPPKDKPIVVPPNRTLGMPGTPNKPKVEPIKVDPPSRLAGDRMVTPKPERPQGNPPKKPGVSPVPGESPPR